MDGGAASGLGRCCLDIEPDIRLFQQAAGNPWGLVPMLLPRIYRRDRPRRAAVAYAGLVARIRADGWQVENYQFPLIADERRAGSDLLQRLAGLVEVTTDREIWMLYSSFLRSVGPGMIWSYGPQAGVIAVGSTGGGPDIPGQPQVPSLGWDELERDLLLAARFCNDLHIHSLEGCVEHGFFERISTIDWDQQACPRYGEDGTRHPRPPHGRALDDRPPGTDAGRRRSLRPFVVTCSLPLSPAAAPARTRGTDSAAGSCSGPAARACSRRLGAAVARPAGPGSLRSCHGRWTPRACEPVSSFTYVTRSRTASSSDSAAAPGGYSSPQPSRPSWHHRRPCPSVLSRYQHLPSWPG